MEYNLESFEKGKFYAFKKKNIGSLDNLRKFVIGDELEVKETSDTWLVKTDIRISQPTTSEKIQTIEEKCQEIVPFDYWNFLLTANGVDLFILKNKRGYITPYCSLLAHHQVIEAYFGLRETARIMLDDPQIENLFYLPVAEMTDGYYIGISTEPRTLGQVFELYNDSGYIPYTPENQAHRHYKKTYKNFKYWLELVLDSHGAEGLNR